MVRRLTGRLLLVAGVIGSGLAGMSAGQAVTYEDRLPAVLATAILGTITLACLGGARIQLRRRGGPSAPALDWEPGPDASWLPQQAWAQLPDVQPRRPRLGPRPPVPSAEVPPDARLRRLWLIRAELAFDQSGGMRSSMVGWSLALGPGLADLGDRDQRRARVPESPPPLPAAPDAARAGDCLRCRARLDIRWANGAAW